MKSRRPEGRNVVMTNKKKWLILYIKFSLVSLWSLGLWHALKHDLNLLQCSLVQCKWLNVHPMSQVQELASPMKHGHFSPLSCLVSDTCPCPCSTLTQHPYYVLYFWILQVFTCPCPCRVRYSCRCFIGRH